MELWGLWRGREGRWKCGWDGWMDGRKRNVLEERHIEKEEHLTDGNKSVKEEYQCPCLNRKSECEYHFVAFVPFSRNIKSLSIRCI